VKQSQKEEVEIKEWVNYWLTGQGENILPCFPRSLLNVLNATHHDGSEEKALIEKMRADWFHRLFREFSTALRTIIPDDQAMTRLRKQIGKLHPLFTLTAESALAFRLLFKYCSSKDHLAIVYLALGTPKKALATAQRKLLETKPFCSLGSKITIVAVHACCENKGVQKKSIQEFSLGCG